MRRYRPDPLAAHGDAGLALAGHRLRFPRLCDLRLPAQRFACVLAARRALGYVWRVNAHGAALAYCTYLIGTLFALASRHRALSLVEAIALILTPLMFNAVILLGADWHMAEIAKLFPPFANIAFPTQVLHRPHADVVLARRAQVRPALAEWSSIGCSATREFIFLLFVSAAIGALTPLIANAAQAVAAPIVLIIVGAVAAALAQAGLWAVVYIATGLLLDGFAGRPASFLAVRRALEERLRQEQRPEPNRSRRT